MLAEFVAEINLENLNETLAEGRVTQVECKGLMCDGSVAMID